MNTRSFLLLNYILFFFFFYINSRVVAEQEHNNSLNPRSNLPQIFTYNELVAATNNFSDSVKVGGFGYVYKGTLPNSNQVFIKTYY